MLLQCGFYDAQDAASTLTLTPLMLESLAALPSLSFSMILTYIDCNRPASGAPSGFGQNSATCALTKLALLT